MSGEKLPLRVSQRREHEPETCLVGQPFNEHLIAHQADLGSGQRALIEDPPDREEQLTGAIGVRQRVAPRDERVFGTNP